MTNTSATGGFLTPGATPAPLEGAALVAVIQTLVVGITGLGATLVRPRWQPLAPTQPAAGTDWCAVGIMRRTPDANAFIGHDPAGDGADLLQRHEALEILASFYGPHCEGYAATLRDGLQVGQNRETLHAAYMGLADCGDVLHVPELVNGGWIDRADFSFVLNRQVRRTYPVLNILSATPATTSEH